MIVRSEKSEQRIVQSRFLQTEENRVGAVERAEAALGQTSQWSSIWFVRRRDTELQLLRAALLENAQNISGIAEVETRERIEERQDAVQQRVGRRDRRVVDETKRCAVRAVGLAEAIIFLVEAAVIIKSGAPQHRAMIHHAVIDVPDDLGMAKSARLLRHPQIAGIDEANELGRLVIQPRIRIRRIGGCCPELLVARKNVRLLFR